MVVECFLSSRETPILCDIFFSTEGIPQNKLLMWYRVHMERLRHQEVKEPPEAMLKKILASQDL